jgi:predicted site-specific integrase-resolvase
MTTNEDKALELMFETDSTTDSMDTMDIEYTVVNDKVIADRHILTELSILRDAVHKLHTNIAILIEDQKQIQTVLKTMTVTITDMSNRIYTKTSSRPSWLGH